MSLVERQSTPSTFTRCSDSLRNASWSTAPQELEGDGIDTYDYAQEERSRVAPTLDECPTFEVGSLCALERIPTISLDNFEDQVTATLQKGQFPCITNNTAAEITKSSSSRKPFHRWMRTFQRWADSPRGPASLHEATAPSDSFHEDFHSSRPSSFHRGTSSDSSFAVLTAVRSVGSSLAGASFLTRSRRNTLRSSRRTDRSSLGSIPGPRQSEDGTGSRPVIMDPAVLGRAVQRRRILEELINTEESYIGDIRFLLNVYITILAALPTLSPGVRSSINRNLTEMVELHEEILGELHQIVPHSEYTQIEFPSVLEPSRPGSTPKHRRWTSLDSVPEHNLHASWVQSLPGMTSEPQIVAEVAQVFSRKMNRFFIYEEFGAKYELMLRDVSSAHRTMPRWNSCQRGLEALAASLGSAISREDGAKKSLTIGDLLMKPIQRICKYPLLFSELLKHTPVIDCPFSHMEVDNTLLRLREATAQINRATDDTRIKAVLEKTWILQDRLVFPNQKFDSISKNRIRSFGHIELCGTLHVCWQTKDGVNGQYMVTLLYKEWLCLATANKTEQKYTIQAAVALDSIKVEDVDNGRGLQCHTAPYSWKTVFISDHQLYEIIMTACTSKEEGEWKSRLGSGRCNDRRGYNGLPIFNFSALDIKSMGSVYGKPGSLTRRLSIQRATTVGPKSPMCQVILKNTSVIRDTRTPSNTSSINRSQSLLTTNDRVPVLTPSRAERARLEAALSDVWTRDVLPFPGMTARSRSEHLVRTSASSVMRKLSVASIAGSFSKRSVSTTSIHKTGATDDGISRSGSVLIRKGDSRVSSQSSTGSGHPMEPDRHHNLSIVSDGSEPCTASRGASVIVSLDSGREADSQQTMREWHGRMRDDAETFPNLPSRPSSRRSSPLRCEAAGISLIHRSPASVSDPNLFSRALSHKNVNQGKENDNSARSPGEQVRSPSKQSSRSRKSSTSRWTRMGVLHRDVVMQGFRSLFR